MKGCIIVAPRVLLESASCAEKMRDAENHRLLGGVRKQAAMKIAPVCAATGSLLDARKHAHRHAVAKARPLTNDDIDNAICRAVRARS